MPAPGLLQSQRLSQHLSPQQILQSSILQLNALMFETRILEELEQNPALDMIEEEPATPSDDETDSQEDEIDWDEILNSPDDFNVGRYVDRSREDFDIQIAASIAFVDRLRAQLADSGITEKQLLIADEILGNLNTEGYLAVEPMLIAERLQISEAELETVRREIMGLHPSGVAAMDLQECLLAQLDALEVEGITREIITHHFDDFANRRYQRLLRSLQCTEEDLQEAMAVISRLNPKPGIDDTSVTNQYIVPDILLDEINEEWVITLNDGSLPELNLSPTYVEMASVRKKYDTQTRQFARRKVEAARWFIQAVQQRRQTIVRVMQAIIERQVEFLRNGDGHLKPMVLKDIAEDIGMDISTISRVTSGKFVQTPNNIYELKYFFSEGLETEDGEEVSTLLIKAELRKIIAAENKRKPHNDDILAGMLKELGYPIARRTVAKYREQLKLPVARLRREL